MGTDRIRKVAAHDAQGWQRLMERRGLRKCYPGLNEREFDHLLNVLAMTRISEEACAMMEEARQKRTVTDRFMEVLNTRI